MRRLLAAGARDLAYMSGAAQQPLALALTPTLTLGRYYHKGAYFQDEDETGNNKLGPVMQQDFGSATGKDSFMDKSSMPEIMQVKNFGFRSQARRESVSLSVSSK